MANSVEDLDAAVRIRKWLDESQHLLGRIIPSLVEEHERLRHETVELRAYVMALQEQVDRLQRERGAIARAAEAHLTEIGRIANEAILTLEGADDVHNSDHPSRPAPRNRGVRQRAPKG